MIVRAGSRVLPGVGPLVPTRSWTIEGPERFGGSRVPTGGAGSWGGGRRPVGLRGYGLSGITIQNVSTGNNSVFRVGDQWQITISGAKPNAGVYLNASQCSPDFSRCTQAPMSGQADVAASHWTGSTQYGQAIATTDASGNLTMSGTFGAAQVGMWTQLWNVGGQLMPLSQFTVVDANGSAQYTGPTVPGGTPLYQQMPVQNIPITGAVPTATPQTLAQQLGSNVILPTGQIVTAQQAAAIATPSKNPAGGGSIVPGSVAFSNLTTGNASVFNVGDSWRVSISGASPNQPVVVRGVQNGKSSTSQLGTTDANGSWSSTGTMDASTVGNWTESWTVGGVPAASLAFTVQAAGQSVTGGTGAPAGGSAAATPAGAVDLSSVESIFTGSAIGGIPNWALIAAGLGLVFVLGGHKK